MPEKIIALKRKVMLAVTILLLCMFSLYYYHVLSRVGHDLDRFNHMNRFHVTEQLGLRLNDSVNFFYSRMDIILNNQFVIKGLTEQDYNNLDDHIMPLFNILLKENPDIAYLKITDNNNRIVYSTYEQPDSGKASPIVKKPFYFFGPNEGRHLFRIIKPVIINGKSIGTIEFALYLEYLDRLLKKIHPPGEYGFLINERYKTPYDKANVINGYMVFSFAEKLMNSVLKDTGISKDIKMTSYKDIKYAVCELKSLNSYVGKEYLKVYMANDISRITTEMSGRNMGLMLIWSVIIIAILIILNYAFNYYIKRFKNVSLELGNLYELFNKGETIIVKFIAGDEPKIDFISKNMHQLLGHNHKDILSGKVSSDVLFGRSLERFAQEVEMNIGNDDVYTSEPFKTMTKDGKMKCIGSKTKHIKDRSGKNVYISFLHDVSKIVEIQTELELKNQELEHLSITDKLTQIYNRLKLDEVLEAEVERSKRYGNPLSVVIIDIDHFKKVNDEFGHQTGDEVLVKITQLLQEKIRATDVLGRWGGEEFLIICTQTDKEGAVTLAETLRRCVAETEIEKVGHKTCSFGVAQLQKTDNADTMIARADDALYKAKEKRNCVVIM